MGVCDPNLLCTSSFVNKQFNKEVVKQLVAYRMTLSSRGHLGNVSPN